MEEQMRPSVSELDTSSSGLLQKIEQAKKNDDTRQENAITINLNKYMIVTVKEKKYALFAEEVREIVSHVPIFYVPFIPPYVRGVINRHGEPYTVLDLQVLFERENLESSTFLILGRENDQLALLISEVTEIVKLPETELHRITSDVNDEHYFLGAISSQNNKDEIFVLNLDNILRKLETDLGAL